MKKTIIWALLIAICIGLFSMIPSSAKETEDLTFGGLISEETIRERGHKYISSNFENTLDAVEYVNEDGTRTAYVFSSPVKYRDANGKIKRIDNTLVKNTVNASWENKANRFGISISEKMEKGAKLTYNDNEVSFAPRFQQTGTYAYALDTRQIDEEIIGFSNNAFAIQYEATYTGFISHMTIPCLDGTTFSFDVAGNRISSVVANGQNVLVGMKDGSYIDYSLVSFSDGEKNWILHIFK